VPCKPHDLAVPEPLASQYSSQAIDLIGAQDGPRLELLHPKSYLETHQQTCTALVTFLTAALALVLAYFLPFL